MAGRATVRDLQLVVWIILLGATVLTAILGIEHSQPSTVVGVLVILIGCIKLRLVVIHFMGLGHAPVALRVAAEAYSAVLLLALLALFLLV